MIKVSTFNYDKYGLDAYEKFTKEHGDKIVDGGIRTFENKIVIVWNDSSDEELKIERLRMSIKESIMALEAKKVAERAREMQARAFVLRVAGNKQAETAVVDAANNVRSIGEMIYYTKEALKELENEIEGTKDNENKAKEEEN